MVARWIRFRVSGFQPRALCVGHVTYFFHNLGGLASLRHPSGGHSEIVTRRSPVA